MGTAARVAVATGGSTVGNYSMIVFTGWDYGSVDEKATKLKQKSIRYRLQVRLDQWRKCMLNEFLSDDSLPLFSFCQVDLEEERLKEKAAALTLCQKVILYSLRVFMSFLSLAFIGATLYCIILATNFSQVNDRKVA